jgi:cold shock CspA family protein
MTTQENTGTFKPDTSVQYIGRVKWFQNKAGYGFISVTNDTSPNYNFDIFVHHSGIIVSKDQYKYLVQGEYVEFKVEGLTSGKHEFQAINVKGINNGKLMCETRAETLGLRRSTLSNTYNDNAGEITDTILPQSVRAPSKTNGGNSWKTIQKNGRVKNDDEIVSV